ncbi:hypothetical protein AVEN_60358-1 [Araneus ventricosus]|uniref:Uncharacterized protein n=1 Tax=Araneus ventricosus TaxID=182803 RepID=A0A4Y2NNM9_ARAVE|nr:hypothetical protein AVEN_60358-1 [Araneus ventricosus]
MSKVASLSVKVVLLFLPLLRRPLRGLQESKTHLKSCLMYKVASLSVKVVLLFLPLLRRPLRGLQESKTHLKSCLMYKVASMSEKVVLLFLPLLRRLFREIQDSLLNNRVEKHSVLHFVERVSKMFKYIFVPERYLTFAKAVEKLFQPNLLYKFIIGKFPKQKRCILRVSSAR